MENVSIWSCFNVNGDVTEIEAIVSTPGLIALDRDDIVSVLEAEGESFVVTGTGFTLNAALDSALANVHVKPETITALVIAVWCNDTKVPMSAFTVLSEFTSTLAPEINVTWGVFSDASFEGEYKIVLISTAKS